MGTETSWQEFLIFLGCLSLVGYYVFVISELFIPQYTYNKKRTKRLFKVSFLIPCYLWVFIILGQYNELE